MPDIYNSNTTVSKSSGMEPPIKKYMYHFSGPLHDVHPAHQMHPRDQMIWRHHFFLTLDDALVSQEHTVLFFENHLCFFLLFAKFGLKTNALLLEKMWMEMFYT